MVPIHIAYKKMVCFPRQGILQANPIRNEGNMN